MVSLHVQLNGESREETMLESEYVGIIRDTLLMGKNVMMTRNFSQVTLSVCL